MRSALLPLDFRAASPASHRLIHPLACDTGAEVSESLNKERAARAFAGMRCCAKKVMEEAPAGRRHHGSAMESQERPPSAKQRQSEQTNIRPWRRHQAPPISGSPPPASHAVPLASALAKSPKPRSRRGPQHGDEAPSDEAGGAHRRARRREARGQNAPQLLPHRARRRPVVNNDEMRRHERESAYASAQNDARRLVEPELEQVPTSKAQRGRGARSGSIPSSAASKAELVASVDASFDEAAGARASARRPQPPFVDRDDVRGVADAASLMSSSSPATRRVLVARFVALRATDAGEEDPESGRLTSPQNGEAAWSSVPEAVKATMLGDKAASVARRSTSRAARALHGHTGAGGRRLAHANARRRRRTAHGGDAGGGDSGRTVDAARADADVDADAELVGYVVDSCGVDVKGELYGPFARAPPGARTTPTKRRRNLPVRKRVDRPWRRRRPKPRSKASDCDHRTRRRGRRDRLERKEPGQQAQRGASRHEIYYVIGDVDMTGVSCRDACCACN